MGSRRIPPFAAAVRSWGDHARLVYEFKGRRVNLKQPEKSLILRKPALLSASVSSKRKHLCAVAKPLREGGRCNRLHKTSRLTDFGVPDRSRYGLLDSATIGRENCGVADDDRPTSMT